MVPFSGCMIIAFENGFHLPPRGGELLCLGIGGEQNLQILLIEVCTVCSLPVGMECGKHLVVGSQSDCTGTNRMKEVVSSLVEAILFNLYRLCLERFGEVLNSFFQLGLKRMAFLGIVR